MLMVLLHFIKKYKVVYVEGRIITQLIVLELGYSLKPKWLEIVESKRKKITEFT